MLKFSPVDKSQYPYNLKSSSLTFLVTWSDIDLRILASVFDGIDNSPRAPIKDRLDLVASVLVFDRETAGTVGSHGDDSGDIVQLSVGVFDCELAHVHLSGHPIPLGGTKQTERQAEGRSYVEYLQKSR